MKQFISQLSIDNNIGLIFTFILDSLVLTRDDHDYPVHPYYIAIMMLV